MRQRGISLVMAAGIMTIIFLLSMVSLQMVNANTTLTRAVYSQSITFNAAESAVHAASIEILEDAPGNYPNLLTDDPDAPFKEDSIAYDLFGGVDMEVSMRDNDDLDGSLTDDVDGLVILTARGFIVDDETKAEADQVRIAQTTLEVLAKYGGDSDSDGYAQENFDASSSSSYNQDVDDDSIMDP